jgi:MFS family permease
MSAEQNQAERKGVGADAYTQVTDTDRRRAAWGGAVGTALEQYDFVIYGTATAIVFNTIFFPNVSPAIGVISAFGAYAVGFVARPVGGFVFAKYGERLGRKWVLVTTLYLMGAATFAIGLLPDYGQIGIFAPVLLVACRFLQGFGAGAEMAGASVLLTEIAERRKRGRYASLVWVGASLGSAMGALVWILVQLLPRDAVLAYGWRLVFFSSALVAIAAYIIRRKLKESPVFEERKAEVKIDSVAPISDVLRNGRRTLLRVFLINVGGNGHSYIYQVFLGTFLIQYVGIADDAFPKMLLIGALVAAVTSWLTGLWTDAWGRRPVALVVHILLFLAPVPMFLLLETGNLVVIGLVIVFGFVVAAEGTVSSVSAFFPELYGSRYRYAGVAIGRETSAVFGGGIAPLISSALITWAAGSWWPVAIYMMAIMGISLVGLLISPETRGRDLLDQRDAILSSVRS